jgi:hypothetical protein
MIAQDIHILMQYSLITVKHEKLLDKIVVFTDE